jgi:hypothetical protein
VGWWEGGERDGGLKETMYTGLLYLINKQRRKEDKGTQHVHWVNLINE